MREHINLIAKEFILGKPSVPLQQRLMAAVLAAVFAIPLLLYIGQSYQAWRLRLDVQKLTSERNRLDQERARLLGDMDTVMKQETQLRQEEEQRLAAVKDLLGERVAWSEVLQEVSFLAPEGLWLVKLETVEGQAGLLFPGASGRTLRFSGMARSHQAINRFIALMEESRRFSAVSLVYTQRPAESPSAMVNFELTAQLQRGSG